MSCADCTSETEEKHAYKTAMAAISRGFMGIAKAAIGYNVVPLDVLQERRKICGSCEFAAPGIINKTKKVYCGPLWDSLVHDTGTCGCLLTMKTMLADESCPKARWGRFTS